jgi:hypothetical protein
MNYKRVFPFPPDLLKRFDIIVLNLQCLPARYEAYMRRSTPPLASLVPSGTARFRTNGTIVALCAPSHQAQVFKIFLCNFMKEKN